MELQQDMHTSIPGKRRILGPCAYILTAANTGSWRADRPNLHSERCIHCGICEGFCPTACITMDRGAGSLEFDWNYCKGCGICANECPKGAITMIPEGGGKGCQ